MMSVITPITIPIQDIELTPGSMITIANVTWERFEAILEALGEKRSTRIAFSNGTLEIMSPLPIHERPHRIIADLVKTFLDAEERNWEDFGSTTFRRQKKQAGLEPDTCFYIQNADRVRDCLQAMDLDVYPPADLAIESDVTSKTTLAAYAGIGVPEVWIYQTGKDKFRDRGTLTIYLLQDGQYQISQNSPTFPDRSIVELIPQLVQQAFNEGTSQMLRQLRQQRSH